MAFSLHDIIHIFIVFFYTYFQKKRHAQMDGQQLHSMTIHNILEKVDLFNFMFDDEFSSKDQKEEGVNQDSGKIVITPNAADPKSAYLGEN